MYMIYPLLCVITPCFIYQIITIKSRKIKDKVNLIPHLIKVYIFLLYVSLAILVAGIGSIWDIGQFGNIIRIEEINLVPFSSSGATTYILNIIMFMPLGFLLPFIWSKFMNLSKVFCVGLCFSLAIEFCQLFNHRVSDIDDLMMNSLGAVFGYLIWLCVTKLFKYIIKLPIFVSVSNTDNQNKFSLYISKFSISKNEAVMYLSLAILGEFLFYNWSFLYI
ncbi:antibiotic resistance protein VanZ [Clostridium sp. NCR]|nr:antibiotic resistance protein VanZ [Clostridium sp. NCR]